MSQAGIVDIEGGFPQIPTNFIADVGSAIPIFNTLNIFGSTQAAGTTPVHTTGSGNTITTIVQLTQATGSSNANNAGLASFDSSTFTVDANGFVSLSGGVGFTWIVVTSADNPVTFAPMTGYICKGAGAVDFILPPAATVGDEYWVKGIGNLWTIAQNAAQTISLGFQTTTAGVTGTVIATQVKDAVQIICVTNNLEFEILTAVGNPTIA
jgi:hypothetical protein